MLHTDFSHKDGVVRTDFSHKDGVVHTDFSYKNGVVRTDFSKKLVLHTDFSIKLVLYTDFSHKDGVVHRDSSYKVDVVHTDFSCKDGVGCLAIPHIWSNMFQALVPNGSGAEHMAFYKTHVGSLKKKLDKKVDYSTTNNIVPPKHLYKTHMLSTKHQVTFPWCLYKKKTTFLDL